MRARLGEEIGEAGDPSALADNVEEITMFASGTVGELTGGTRPGSWAGQTHEQRPTGVIPQIADDPVRSLPPSGGKVVTTNAFGMGRKLAQDFFCFQ